MLTGWQSQKNTIQSNIPKEEILKFAAKGFDELKAHLKEKCSQWEKSNIAIGVIGEVKSGKSSFINVVRGLDDNAEGAAEVDTAECTKTPTPYEYPNNKLITLWDLPGIGTKTFPKETYMEAIKASRFDFFLIMSQNVFTKLDFWLADELRKRGKNFFFVRTHIDITVLKQQRIKKIKIEEKNEQGEITEEMKALMEKVRGECVEGLEIRSEEKNQIFIISNWHSDMFEFSKLVVAISSDLSELQREAFLYSTRTETKEIYEAKKKALKKRIIFVSFCSGVAGAVPIPGSSLVVDTSLIMQEIKFYKAQFNLDDPSFNTTIKYRPEASGLLKAIATIGTKAYVLRVVGKSVATSILEETAKIFSWFTLGAASAVLGLTSYGSAYYILTRELDKIADLSNQLLDLKLEVMMKKT